jgi:hypothetical protein
VFNELTDTQKRHARLIDRTIVKGKSLPIDVYEVFSADSSDEIKMKSESAKNLEKLVNLYYSEKVSEAEKYFKKILETAPKDTVTRQWSKRFT